MAAKLASSNFATIFWQASLRDNGLVHDAVLETHSESSSSSPLARKTIVDRLNHEGTCMLFMMAMYTSWMTSEALPARVDKTNCATGRHSLQNTVIRLGLSPNLSH